MPCDRDAPITTLALHLVSSTRVRGTEVLDQIYIDILRSAHLICFAAGMGTALYYDFVTIRSINDPISGRYIDTVERLHDWISWAFIGLWVTGIALIYVRTSFDLDAFSPKLWEKVGVMVLMTLNARLIGSFVLPMLKRNLGRAVIDMPLRELILSSQVAITSIFCWTTGLVLGSSLYLKTAPWGILLPLAVGWFALCTLGGQVVVQLIRRRARAGTEVQLQMAFDYR